MNRAPFMPPLNSRWRLTQDVIMPDSFFYRIDNESALGLPSAWSWLSAENRTREEGNKWVEDYQAYLRSLWPDGVVIPAGTVVSFNRYHASNSGDMQMTLHFIISPDPRLTPRKRGGKGKGRMRFYLNLDEFNSLGELEDASDVHD